MKNRIQKLLLSIFIILTPIIIKAQVQGISYTLSPYAEYNWFNKNSGFGNGLVGGAQLGLGFGEYVELRANYATGLSLQSDLSNFGFVPTEEQIMDYTPIDLKLTRVGGEMKLNFSKGNLLPYFTIGTGIQSIGIDTFETNKQIFVNTGAGVKISGGDRYTIGLQAINHTFNFNAANGILSESERELYGLQDAESERLSHWALRGSLVLYIGGRRPGQITDIDKAYWDNFSGGFQGLNVPLEVNISKMNFHEDLPYRDTWMGGASLGLNFGPLVGVRGFYWKSFEDGITSRFDELSMYGAEARFKLNEGKGFTPWVTIGGGNIHATPEYVGVNDSILIAENKGFAMGGIGIDLPFSKYVNATGFVRSMLTTSENVEDLAAPDQLNNSWNYGVSLNFNLGKKRKKIDVVKQDVFDEYILSSNEQNDNATNELKSQYEDRIKDLESQLSQAVIDQDAQAVKDLSEEKNKAEQIVQELDKGVTNGQNKPSFESGQSVPTQNSSYNPNSSYSPSEIRMTPAEFQLLLQEILKATKSGGGTSYIEHPTSNGNIESALADYKKDQQIESLKADLNELKDQIKSLVVIQERMDNSNVEMESDLTQLIKTSEERVSKIQQQLEKSENNMELINERQIKIENGLTDANVEIQSFESDQLKKELEFSNQRIDDLRMMLVQSLEQMNSRPQAIVQPIKSDTIFVENTEVSNRTVVQSGREYDNGNSFFSKFKYKGMSGFAGFSVGGSATFNMGYRLHYQIGADSSNFEFMPESFFGFGSPSSFGITANGVWHLDNLTKSELVNPYVGLGVGFMKVGDNNNADKLTGALNFIVGTSLNVFAGDMYVDFTARNIFKYNQLIVGYRFPF